MTTQTETTSSQPISLRPESPPLSSGVNVDTDDTEHMNQFDTIPQFQNVADKRQWMLEEMAAAFRIFARKGYGLGSAGHISVRDPEHPDQFWLNPLGRHFGTLKASDMVLVDHEGRQDRDGVGRVGGRGPHGSQAEPERRQRGRRRPLP